MAAGTYYEDLDLPNTQGIDLISESGADLTVIDRGGSLHLVSIGMGVDSTTVIKGFTIQNGESYGLQKLSD